MHHHDHHSHMIEDFKKRLKVSVIFTIPILLLSPTIQSFLGIADIIRFPFENILLFLLSTFIFFYGGRPFLKGVKEEIKDKNPGMMTLIGLAITVAYVFSTAVTFGFAGDVLFWELATLIDVMLLGHWLEMRSVMGASQALEELSKLIPQKAHKITRAGKLHDISVKDLQRGDIVMVRPGEKVPVDGIIIDGKSSLNESLLTGESRPVEKKKGDSAIAGAINTDGSLTIKVQKIGKDSFISQIINLVEKAQKSKSKTQNLANKAAKYLTFIAVTAGLLTFAFWIFSGHSASFAIQRTVAVMVITCPHALGVAIPLVVAVSTAQTSKKGILIRNRTAFEKARQATAVIFDKTGTLTEGRFGVKNIIQFSSIPKDKILKYAAALESHSEHPIAKAISEKSKTKLPVSNFKSYAGIGVEGKVDKKRIKIVNPSYLREKNINFEKKIIENESKGKTTVFVLQDNKPIGAIVLEDIIKKESKNAIKTLQNKNIKTIMLTGDAKSDAKVVADRLGVDEYFAEVMPDKKEKKVREIQKRGEIVAMVGDGVNDAPALAQADIGIAIGSGTDVARESADIVLVKNDPRDAAKVITYSSKTYKKMIENLIYATGYNIVAIPLAAGALYSFGILLSPAIGAVLMSLSTIVVAISAKRLQLS